MPISDQKAAARTVADDVAVIAARVAGVDAMYDYRRVDERARRRLKLKRIIRRRHGSAGDPLFALLETVGELWAYAVAIGDRDPNRWLLALAIYLHRDRE